jgi:hypothetical protein
MVYVCIYMCVCTRKYMVYVCIRACVCAHTQRKVSVKVTIASILKGSATTDAAEATEAIVCTCLEGDARRCRRESPCNL